MSYNELIKNFNCIRDYMRDFYIYGFKSREKYNKKSMRSYDDERRRIESWLGDYMGFKNTSEGKTVFLSIDSRSASHNPLYKAWKSSSFTDGDITLHFILLDILYSPDISLSLSEITTKIDREYTCKFELPALFDESTVRKKLKEYIDQGLIVSEKHGKKLFYRRNENIDISTCSDALNFFSEVAPCGVIGSFLLDKYPNSSSSFFTFKHHYITQTMDSDILCILFTAISEKREVSIKNLNRNGKESTVIIVPLKIFISVQNGRQYLMAYHAKFSNIKAYRLDYIVKANIGEKNIDFDIYRKKLDNMTAHMWGVSSGDINRRLEHIEFIIHINDGEEHIFRRLEREKRCGTVEKIDSNTCRFYADVYDTNEMIPWIRTFICRIVSINFSNSESEHKFKSDLEAMYKMYNIGGNKSI